MTFHLENQMREKTLSYSLTDIFTFQKFISISVFKQNVGGQLFLLHDVFFPKHAHYKKLFSAVMLISSLGSFRIIQKESKRLRGQVIGISLSFQTRG